MSGRTTHAFEFKLIGVEHYDQHYDLQQAMINDAEVNRVQQEVKAAEDEAVEEESTEAAAPPGLLLAKQTLPTALALTLSR